MFHFLPSAVRYDGSAPAGGHGYQVHVGPMSSDARGTVRIGDADLTHHPRLRFNYLSTAQDRRDWIQAVRIARAILNQPALAAFNGGELSPARMCARTPKYWPGWLATRGDRAAPMRDVSPGR